MNAPLSDPHGLELLAHRLSRIPAILSDMLTAGPRPLAPATLASERFIVTGTGSSEAHARYLATLFNLHTDRAAAYLPLSGFVDAPAANFAGKTLVVFSQGVSPNAQIALQRGRDFAHTILFSATTPEAAEAAGKPDRAQLLRHLIQRGGELIEFPLAEEYTTLIRFVGPLAGYLATLQFAAQFPRSRVPVPSAETLLPLLEVKAPPALREAMCQLPSAFAGGFNVITAAPISDYSQNLACKFMEGLYWNCPAISDFLQFAHGPFQQMTAHPKPAIILQGDGPGEAEMVQRSVNMLRGVGAGAYVIQVDAPPLLSIFGFESALNDLVFAVMRHLSIDQVNWPGKGRDDLLYGFCPDG
ncbi:creatininase [Synoicihabitans lomoniglobus]|uniref:Creatininase n=1 Tax=Synoicihabitans lomoniglobus TaxID=2909285 RepID=A0AAF0CSD7_9BACT|nr:creatininase [Opitutaceae bacterium LMO-M01]WED67158.1 creatininase [Opitutaceae bacterium LMO-M01]